MEAILLVGGKGTRLRPLTVTTPKPMLPTAGVPFLTHQLVRARDAGVEHVVLSTSYRPEVFRAYFGTGADIGLRIDYVTEEEPLGTGGGIVNVTDLLTSGPDDPVLVFNGDVLSGHDIGAQVAMHRETSAAVTLHLTEVADARAFGCVPTDEHGRVTAFVEKSPNPVTNHINAGCYVFRRSVIDEVPRGRPVSVERETFPDLLERGMRLTGYVDASYWLDIGTPAAYVRASADLVTGTAPSGAVPCTGERLVDATAVLDASARVTGGSAVGPGARVAAGAVVEGSVLLDGATVGPGALVTSSVVGRAAAVGADSRLVEAVLGDEVRVGARNELLSGVRLWPGTVLGDVAVRFSTDA